MNGLDSELVQRLARLLELASDEDLQVEIIRPARSRWQVVLWREPVVGEATSTNLAQALSQALAEYEKRLRKRRISTKIPHV